MRLFSEIARALGAEAGTCAYYTVVEGRGGYFQNVKRILAFSETEVVFRTGGGALRVSGRGLSIGKYTGGDVSVSGEIERVERA